ncbi:hypothetical protein EOE18_13700 [Novosphingobium umbonatum]|uniref:Uncharacterized protein n=1 Tax=Novosphingobium umbonatum TaxID=1908524 RepID=A0A437N1W8_9SPHN|nr:hypothetical protein [Novosphingobium umbonatum]RVU03909.1 hypothetical protein EOE18_13700 [Novosphingobium umbonatum]
MTMRREPLTYENTMLVVAELLGWDTVAGLCGVSLRSARYWSEPECQKQIRMIDAERLDRAYVEAGGSYRPFHRLMTMRLDIAEMAINATAMDLTTATAVAAKEAGEAISALILATQSGAPATIRTAKREAEEAITALQASVAAMDARDSART